MATKRNHTWPELTSHVYLLEDALKKIHTLIFAERREVRREPTPEKTTPLSEASEPVRELVFEPPPEPAVPISVQSFRHPFYDVAFSTLDKAHDGFTILSGETKVIQRAVEVAQESLPVLFVNAHALVLGFVKSNQEEDNQRSQR